MFKMNKRERKGLETLRRNNMECCCCGRELKQVSKRKFRKWESGEVFLKCKFCRKKKI